jgi:hypothetical protein
VNSGLFWKSLLIQAVAVGFVFGILVALPLGDDFFEDYGWLAGPLAWLACSFVTARLIDVPLSYVLFSAVAGGVAGGIVFLVAGHLPGMIAGLLVFAASCATWDPEAAARVEAAESGR